MTEVDWSALFKSFYETVRVKVAYKDFSKIPHQRLYEMNKKLHVVVFTVEAEQEKTKTDLGSDGGDGGDDDLGDDGEEDDLLDDDPSTKEQPPHTQGPPTDTQKTPVSKSNSNSGYKTVSMEEMNIELVDQDRYLKECMEGRLLLSESVSDKLMGDVAVSNFCNSELAFKSRVNKEVSPHRKLPSDVGVSVEEAGKTVVAGSSLEAVSMDGVYSLGAKIYPSSSTCHLSGVQKGAFIENYNNSYHWDSFAKEEQVRDWSMQDLTSKSTKQSRDFSSSQHLHSMEKMVEQLPIGENTYTVEVTPECALMTLN